MSIDWGSVPDWIAGVAGSTALLFAALAVRAANRTDRRQGEQLAGFERDRRRQQADRLAIWMDFERDPRAPAESPTWKWQFNLRNASDLPVYEVRAWANLKDVHDNARLAFVWFRTLPPSEDVLEIPAFDGSFASLRAEEYNEPLKLVNVAFRDAGGNCWFRRESQLELIGYAEYQRLVIATDIQAGRSRD